MTLIAADLIAAIDATLRRTDHARLSGAPDGVGPIVTADLARARLGTVEAPVLLTVVLRDDQRLRLFEQALGFVAPEMEKLIFPGLGLPAL